MAARGEAQADVEVSTLVVPAWRLRWRAPELALVLGERAVALASTRRDEIDRLRAESLVIFASNRMGRGVRIADRALDALRASDKAGEQETSWRLRIELAACATAVGAPLTGFGAVRPVLAAEGVPHALRAAALVQASDCLVTIGRGPQLGMALSEADQLYVADTLIDADTRLLQRGLLHASAAAQHRRWGDLQAATDAAGKGLELLAGLGDPTVDSGQVRAKLTLELVCALMDSNRLGEASEIGSPLLDLPVRAPSAGDVGWLRLALATRVHLPAGRVDLARGMLRDAADSAQRHQLDTLLAESLLALAHVHEVSGDLAEALTDLRSAHAAERRRARAVYAVRARLAAEFSGAHRQPVSPHEQLGGLLRPGDGRTSSAQGAMRGSQPPADAVLAPELKQQLRQWRPTPAPKQEGPRVRRSLRAAEDMTVEGISAARAHAADRWRLVQPFGATAPDTTPDHDPAAPVSGRRRAEDREQVATEAPAAPEQGDEGAVPATGLIAAAGAMRSGRRRAAREAAEDDTGATQAPPVEPVVPTAPTAPWAAEQPAPEPVPEPVPDGTSDPTPEVANVLDTLKAAGLMDKRRTGGRRRAPDAEDDQSSPRHPAVDPSAANSSQAANLSHAANPSQAADFSQAANPSRAANSSPAANPSQVEPSREQPAPETPKWRVEPPQRLRSEDDQPKPPPSDLFDTPTTVQPAVGVDGLPVERPSTGLGAAFAKGPVIPTARTPQPSSAPEPPRSTRQGAPDQTQPGDHPGSAPHIGPDFHLGADSLGRSGFRPASAQPTAPGAFPPDTPHQQIPTSAEPQRPPTTTPGQAPTPPDFRLPSDSFGRDGFRTAGAPTDSDPTTPHDWPPAPDRGPSTTPPQDPTWALGDHASQDPAHGTSSQSADWAAGGASGHDAEHHSPDTGTRAWPSGTGHQQDHGPGAEPGTQDWATGSTPGQTAGHQAAPGFGAATRSSDWATTGDSTGFPATGSRPNPALDSRSQGRAPGSHSTDWAPSAPASGDSDAFTGTGAPRAPETDSGLDTGHRADHGSRPGFDDSPNWATYPDHGSASDPADQPGSATRPEFDQDPRHSDHSADTGSQHASGHDGGYDRPDHSVEAGSRYASGDGDGFGRPDHGVEAGSHYPAGDGYGQSDHDAATGSQHASGHDGGYGQSDHGVEAGARYPVGGGGGFGQSDQGPGAGSRYASGDGDGFGQSDHAAGSGSQRDFGQSGGGAGVGSQDGSGGSGGHGRADHGLVSDDGRGFGVGQAGFGAESRSGTPSWAVSARPNWDPGFTGADDAEAYPGSAFGVGSRSDFSIDADFSHLPAPESLTVPRTPDDPTPDHEPDQVPAVPEPDQIPPIPDPDPIPQPAPIPMPPTSSGFDLGRSRFLSSADVEDDLPELPRRVPVDPPPVEDPDPFVTAVVVGDRTIEVPSAARASRRHKSDLSLAELLTEALVAYETGRRSDPGSDQTAGEEIADWISSAETPVSPISPDRLERAGHHVAEPEAEQASTPSAHPTDSEKTTYLTPIRDVESTAPIWETGPDGEPRPPYDSWTLPET